MPGGCLAAWLLSFVVCYDGLFRDRFWVPKTNTAKELHRRDFLVMGCLAAWLAGRLPGSRLLWPPAAVVVAALRLLLLQALLTC